MKRSVQGRGFLLDRDSSQLLRYAIEYHEGNGWKDIPFAVVSPAQEARLKRWVESTSHLSYKEALALLAT